MERLSAQFKGIDNNFMEVWRPRLDYLPRDLRDVILKGKAVLS